jgi:hypothetical protein
VEYASLVKVLFTHRNNGTAVDNMFGAYPVDTRYFSERGLASSIRDLTPASYWRSIFHNPNWRREEVI